MRRGARLAGLLSLTALVLTGCGIRSTEVPTDFGAAPTRVGCSLPGSGEPDGVGTQSGRDFAVQVYLVCTSQLVTVDRTVTVEHTTSDRVTVARELLAELARKPSAAESGAGYSTDVGARTRVSGPQKGDPADALRLNTPPDDLSPYALAQIVCTFANSKVTAENGDRVVLGGPGDDALRSYECSDAVKARPGLIPAPAETVG